MRTKSYTTSAAPFLSGKLDKATIQPSFYVQFRFPLLKNLYISPLPIFRSRTGQAALEPTPELDDGDVSGHK